MKTGSERPTGLLRHVVRWLVPASVADPLLADLDEGFRSRVAERGPLRARLWFTRQVWLCLWPGNVTRLRRLSRDWRPALDPAGNEPRWSGFVGDARIIVRNLRRRWAFTAMAAGVLALGIGSTTAVFSIVNGVLLRPYPFPEADRLVTVWQTNTAWRESPFPQLQRIWDRFSVAMPVLSEWETRQHAFTALGGYGSAQATFTGGERPEAVTGVTATSGVFAALAVPPALGRLPGVEDDRPGAPPILILSHGLWSRRFGSDPNVIGRSVVLDGQPVEVVGVMPSDFHFPSRRTEFWRSFPEDQKEAGWDTQFMRAIARLADGTPMSQAADDMERVTAAIVQDFPVGHADRGVRVVSWREERVGETGRALLVLLGAVGVVLLIACVNIANLLFVRATERRRELAVRAALGAGRHRLARQLVTEAVAIALVGGVLGAVVVVGLMDLITSLLPPGLPRASEVRVDGTVLLFCMGASLATGLLAGWLPGRHAGSLSVGEMLKDQSTGAGTGRRTRRTLNALVVCEIAMAFVLVVGAGVLIRNFQTLVHQDVGFETAGLLTARIELPEERYADQPAASEFFRALYRRLEADPGIVSAGGGTVLPFWGSISSHTVELETDDGRAEVNIGRNLISGDYFDAVGIPLESGRTFSEAELWGTEPVAVINRAMADEYWPGRDPLGQLIHLREPSPPHRIVGVVGDVRLELDDRGSPGAYYSLSLREEVSRRQTVVLRTLGEPAALAGRVREVVWALDPDLPVRTVATMEALVANTTAVPRFQTFLLGSFAGLAWLLAVLGIYAVMSFVVTQRIRDVGIRLSLGASESVVLRSVLGHAARLALLGVTLGVVGSLVTLRSLQGFLFQGTPFDVRVMLAGAAILVATALSACVVPALRAAHVDPVELLRAE